MRFIPALTRASFTILFIVLSLISNAQLTATITGTDAKCNGGNEGSASVVASGGVSPYTYSWSPSGGSTASAISLFAGNYTCTIRDNAGTTIMKSITISQPSALVAC